MVTHPLTAAAAAEIRAEMGRQNLSTVGLASRLGENDVWVFRRIKGRQQLTLVDVERFAAALDIPWQQLLPVQAAADG